MGRDKGFTLIELMVVVAIIAVIAAIAIPNLLEARKSANERSAIGLLRAVHTAQTIYRDRDTDRNNIHDYARASGNLRGLLGVVDTAPDRHHNGYDWGILDDVTEPAEETFVAVAAPVVPGKSGDHCFAIDESGVIRFADGDAVAASHVEPSYASVRLWRPLGQEGDAAPVDVDPPTPPMN